MNIFECLSSLFAGTREIASPSDIVPQESIKVSSYYNAASITIDYSRLNIPFNKPPKIVPIMEIPDTNSMDGLMDYGNNPLYIEPADDDNHKILCDWLYQEFMDSKGLLANDCVYRIPADFSQSAAIYAIHRIYKVGYDSLGRWWKFKGINNPRDDGFLARDENILWLNTGVIF